MSSQRLVFQTSAQVEDHVRLRIANVTRYPLDILTLGADLEDDLGVDSVKQAEILAVLAADIGVDPARIPGRKLRTIGSVVELVSALLAELAAAAPVSQAPVVTAPVVSAPPAPVATAPVATTPVATAPVATPPAAVAVDVEARVRAIFSRVTRYPEALLTGSADIEDDLGIDSVKQAEIVANIAVEFPSASELDPRREKLRTLAQIAAAVSARIPAAAAAPILPAPAPAPVAVAVPAAAPKRTVAAPLPLDGRVALVTGSGRGIGKVLAKHLAKLGATVVVNSFHSREAGEATAAEIVAQGGRAVHVWGSVSNEAHLDTLFAEIDTRFGGLDLLVCNASDGLIGPFDRITPKDWERAFRTNITGTYECAMRGSRLMRQRGGGAIVTMSTVASSRYLQGFGCQGVVKSAVESLTRYLAFELAPYGIRTNCVSAGPVYGDLITKFPDNEERIAHWESITPGGELCTPDDVAEITAFLLGDAAARVNGAVWVVDNGVSGQIDGRVARAPMTPLPRVPAVGSVSNGARAS